MRPKTQDRWNPNFPHKVAKKHPLDQFWTPKKPEKVRKR